VLWYQGESDAASSVLAAAWPLAFTELVAALRSDLAAPDLPIVVVSIGDPPVTGRYAARFPAWSEIQAVQASLTIDNVRIVAAAGLPRNADELHLSTAGQLALGRRMAETWLAQSNLGSQPVL
jgi:hypothetical protein